MKAWQRIARSVSDDLTTMYDLCGAIGVVAQRKVATTTILTACMAASEASIADNISDDVKGGGNDHMEAWHKATLTKWLVRTDVAPRACVNLTAFCVRLTMICVRTVASISTSPRFFGVFTFNFTPGLSWGRMIAVAASKTLVMSTAVGRATIWRQKQTETKSGIPVQALQGQGLSDEPA
eukprot:1377532-Pleurochrysis_carterae.AAC.1